MLKRFLSIIIGLLALCATSAQASILINVDDVGSDLVFSYSGSLDLTGATVQSRSIYMLPYLAVNNSTGSYISFGTGNIGDKITGVTHFTQFASTNLSFSGTSLIGSGDPFGVFFNSFGVPLGYTSGTELSGTLTVLGKSMASVGLIAGIYETGALPSGDLIRLEIAPGNPSAVPEPATFALLGFGLIGMAGITRKK